MNKLMLFGKQLLDKACEQGVNNRAAFLKNVSTVGWVLSCLAQVGAIIINDKIPSKEKKFLIPQEIMEGVVNVALFWCLTSRATDWGRKLVLTKKFIPKSLAPHLKDFKPKSFKVEKLQQEFFNHVRKTCPNNFAEAHNAIEGIGLITSIIGSVVACNLVTPIIRNKLASIYQTWKLKKQGKPNEQRLDINEKFGNVDFKKYEQQFVKRPVFRDTASILPPSSGLKI
ncbi:MAG: hypothetical protein PHX18_07430 [Candidatus Gastranaerophilales bacterium]|nr:hypothetical protein [Candidatus Gastranaerophilales bacterium]